MGKYRDLYNKMMQDDEFEEHFNSIEDLPKFKDKYVMFDPIEDNESDIHDVITDPEFSKAFAGMSDSDKKSILAMIMNLQYDAVDGNWSEDKILNMLDASDNPVTSETIIDKDNDGDADVTITKQDDGDDSDKQQDTPHDQGLAGDTTLEEELMLKPDMSPTEFSKKAAEKRGAKPGEPAPDFNNFTNAIAKNLASRRW